MNTENLSALFENGAYTLVVQKNGVTVHKDFGRGVGPALRVFDAQPELLKGALVCDTIVGKAAAAIYLLGGASGVYAEIMSAAAADFLIANGVDCACETKTEKLLNGRERACARLSRLFWNWKDRKTACPSSARRLHG